MKENENYFKTNLRRWNELVEINAKSKFILVWTRFLLLEWGRKLLA